MSATDQILAMIAETQRWRKIHRDAAKSGTPSRAIDAAACAIRETALRDALRVVERSET